MRGQEDWSLHIATEPSTMTSTNDVATVSQILNLKDNELDTLAQFLGHDIRVHRKVSLTQISASQTTPCLQNGAMKHRKHNKMDRG